MQINSFILTVLGSLLFTAGSVFAGSSASELKDYTDIQELLAKSTFDGVSDSAKKLSADAKANHQSDLSKASDQLAEAKDLASARDQFVKVSKLMIPLAKSEKNKDYDVMYCPMKKARWVQRTGAVANPYYGTGEMLECGVKEN
jgi:hypothetical protein